MTPERQGVITYHSEGYLRDKNCRRFAERRVRLRALLAARMRIRSAGLGFEVGRRNNARPGVFDMGPGGFAINSGFVLEEAGRTPTMEISIDRGLQR
jgi:hypothetical protein